MQVDQRDGPISFPGVGLTDKDIYEAMKSIPGYIDITPGDFKELYCLAYKHAVERFTRSVTAKDIMIERVLHVLPDTDLAEAARLLSDNSISGLPVIDADRKVVGVVSEKDILSQLGFRDKVSFMAIVTQCLQAGGCLSLPVRTPAVREIMSSPAITVSPRTPLVEIAKLLTEKGINRLPVTDPQGRLLGIVARSDIVNATLRSGTCSPNTSGK